MGRRDLQGSRKSKVLKVMYSTLEGIRNWVRHHPILAYFVLAYTLSWSISALLIADYNGLLAVPGGLHYLVSFGPALAALLVTVLISGRRGLAELQHRIVRWRTKWLIVGLVSPLALSLVAILANYLLTGHWPDVAFPGAGSLSGRYRDRGRRPALGRNLRTWRGDRVARFRL